MQSTAGMESTSLACLQIIFSNQFHSKRIVRQYSLNNSEESSQINTFLLYLSHMEASLPQVRKNFQALIL